MLDCPEFYLYNLHNNYIKVLCTGDMYSCPMVLLEKSGEGHTCKNSLYVLCQQSSKMNHVCPLPITKFLTCEISSLIPTLLKNENKAIRLLVDLNLECDRLLISVLRISLIDSWQDLLPIL